MRPESNAIASPPRAAGSPRFEDPDLEALAGSQGTSAAWMRAFALHGEDAAQRVHGDFSVGLTAPDGSVFLAVDRFAIRTMCYRIDDGHLRFAERADELASGDADVDPQAIFDYFYFHVIPSPRTVFRGVFRLPPGHFALFRNGQLRVAPYWRPTFNEGSGASFEELKGEFRQLLHDAVGTLATPDIGCFLSGGTDSSTVAGMLGQVTGRKARTFSIGFDAAGYDEMEYSRIAARHFNAEHHEYYITPEDLIESIPKVAASFDQPFGNSSVLPAYYCARMARENGIDRMLGGDGGDELFGGNTRYAKQRVFGIYDHVPGILKSALLQPLLADNPVASAIPLVRKAASYVKQARVPMPDRMEGYNLLMRLGMTDVMTPAFLARIDAGAPAAHQREVYGQCGADSLVNRMLAYDWRYTLGEIDLPKVVGATALAGMPTAFPLLDDRLVAFSTRLPSSYKVKGLKLRWFFKEALRGFLPDEIITKKKQGFGLPFGPWTARHPGLFALADESLNGLAQRGVLRREFVDALMKQRLHEHPGYFGEMIWISMMLEQWLRAHAPGFRVA
jgi:asparagine synthase (glutamine-hydrolysing)